MTKERVSLDKKNCEIPFFSSNYWNKRGLQFGDATTEDEFLNKSSFSLINLDTAAIITALYGIFTIITVVVQAQYVLTNPGLPDQLFWPYVLQIFLTSCVGLLLLTSFSIFVAARSSFKKKTQKRTRVLVRRAVFCTIAAFVGFFLRNFLDTDFLQVCSHAHDCFVSMLVKHVFILFYIAQAMFLYSIQASVTPNNTQTQGPSGFYNASNNLNFSRVSLTFHGLVEVKNQLIYYECAYSIMIVFFYFLIIFVGTATGMLSNKLQWYTGTDRFITKYL